MRVVHSVAWYFPEHSGGTEVYVSGLARSLKLCDVESLIAAPVTADQPNRYTHEGFDVFRYPIGHAPTIAQIRGLEPDVHVRVFQRWLDEQICQVYHQHSWAYGCELFSL